MDACTIVARRELARARVLVDTYRAYHPDGDFTVLVLDGVPGADAVQGARAIAPRQLGGDSLELLLAGNPIEALDAALLPHVLRHLASQRPAPLLYLAPGMRVLGPLRELAALASAHELVVVSRTAARAEATTKAFTGHDDGGAISRGVIAMTGGQRAQRVLEAWPSYFADGAGAVDDWFERLPAIGEDVAVQKGAAYGVDLSTVSAERIEDGTGELRVDREPVRLVDFSALDPLAPERLEPVPREARLESAAAVTELRRRHARELLAAGYEEDRERGWRFGALEDGTALNSLVRKLLLEAVEQGRLDGSPFSARGLEELHAFLNEPARHGARAGLTRLHEEIWRARSDVRAAYRHLDGPDGPRFASWLCEHAGEDHGIADVLLPWKTHEQMSMQMHKSDAPEPLWGVNVAGLFNSERGLGEAARLLLAGLDARAVPALPVAAHLVPAHGGIERLACVPPREAPYPINIVCVNGELIAPFACEVGPSFFAGRHTIALWWWELSRFPDGWERAFERLDEIWVGSRHIYDAIAPRSPVPVVKMRMPVAMPRVPDRSRTQLGMPEEGFTFLYVHDYHSTAARKNPLGVVQAFKRAFDPGSGARLVVKSMNAQSVAHEHDRVVLAAREHPDITLIDAYVPVGEKNAMIAACDCYVSLHRSEGFGLTAAEAMLLGKPVIATGYGGNLEFMHERNSYLVRWQPVEVGPDAYPYPPDASWAEPDLDHAAALMREVFENRPQARECAERARREIVQRHSPAAAGEQIEARLRLIYERLERDGLRSLKISHRLPIVHPKLPELIDSEPALTQGTGLRSRVKRAMQRVVARLLRRFVARQRLIDTRLYEESLNLKEGMHELAEEFSVLAEELDRRQQDRFGRALAAARVLEAKLRDAHVALDTLERRGAKRNSPMPELPEGD